MPPVTLLAPRSLPERRQVHGLRAGPTRTRGIAARSVLPARYPQLDGLVQRRQEELQVELERPPGVRAAARDLFREVSRDGVPLPRRGRRS